MIFIDTDGCVYTDSNEVVTDAIKQSLKLNGDRYKYVPDFELLYLIDDVDTVKIVHTSHKPFLRYSINIADRAQFLKSHCLYMDAVTIRDIGAGLCKAYSDNDSFPIPMELITNGKLC